MYCPNCRMIFFEPQSLSCGHTLCINCIILMLKKYSNNVIPLCPICNLKVVNIYINYSITALVEKWYEKTKIEENIKEKKEKLKKQFLELLNSNDALKYCMYYHKQVK